MMKIFTFQEGFCFMLLQRTVGRG